MTEREQDVGAQLAGWGKVALLETRGRITGQPVRTAVGFDRQPDGSLLVAAGTPESDWTRNLQAEPRCRLTIGQSTDEYLATELTGDERARAVVALILKYGTPAERLGRGPAFRLQRVEEVIQ